MDKPTLSTQDINGKESAKRKWAARLLWITLGSFIFYFITSLIFSVVIYYDLEEKTEFRTIELITPYVKEMWIWIAVGGFGALGLTVFEFLSNYFKKN